MSTGVVATKQEPVAGVLLAIFAETIGSIPERPLPSCGPAWAQVMRRARGSPAPRQCGQRIYVDAKGEKSICSFS